VNNNEVQCGSAFTTVSHLYTSPDTCNLGWMVFLLALPTKIRLK